MARPNPSEMGVTGISQEVAQRLHGNPDARGVTGFSKREVPTTIVFERTGKLVTAHMQRKGEPPGVIGATAPNAEAALSTIRQQFGFRGDVPPEVLDRFNSSRSNTESRKVRPIEIFVD